nr:hypothetical protein [Tanacetum cinerariifolium]
MSDSDESRVTYTDISSPFEELSDIRSPRANDHEHLELPEMLEDPYVEAHPEDDDDEDPEEDPVDYLADGGDDGDDEEGPIRSLGYRAAMIRLRAKVASTSSPPLQLPSASRREDRPEVTLPP